MGTAASTVREELQKPLDGSDLETLSDARSEVARLRWCHLFSLADLVPPPQQHPHAVASGADLERHRESGGGNGVRATPIERRSPPLSVAARQHDSRVRDAYKEFVQQYLSSAENKNTGGS